MLSHESWVNAIVPGGTSVYPGGAVGAPLALSWHGTSGYSGGLMVGEAPEQAEVDNIVSATATRGPPRRIDVIGTARTLQQPLSRAACRACQSIHVVTIR